MEKSTSRLLSILLVLCMALALLPETARAATSGKCGDNLTWSLSNGTLTISGQGNMFDYVDVYGSPHTTAPWDAQREEITSVVIEDGIFSIGDKAFQYCNNLTNVTISNGVVSIGDWAFCDCSALTGVTIPNSITAIGRGAFYSCSALISMIIPNSVTTIEVQAFSHCASLPGISVASGNTVYKSVDGVLFDSNQTVLYTYPAGKNGTSYRVPASVIKIEEFAFDGCNALNNVTIPNGVTTIEWGAFMNCTGLSSVTIGNNINSIGNFAFASCSGLTSVVIPYGVKSIGEGAFYNCNNLIDVYFGGSENQWKEIKIEANNYQLLNATIHYNSTGRDEAEETPWDKYKIYRDLDSGGDDYEGFDVSLEDCMIKTASTTYNPQLAHMLMALSNAAYSDFNILKSYRSLGFNYDDSNRYPLAFITYSIATKQLDDGTTLALVVVRGSGDILDWMSNFDLRVNGSGYHTGFSDATDEIYKSLTARLGGENFSNVKFVITGHSRGAAAANLLEVKLGQKGVSQKNIYGYNFACPDVAVGYGSSWNPSGKYDNIFNIGHAADPVSLIPGVLGDNPLLGSLNRLKSWGKFGQSRWFAKNWLDALEVGEANIWNATNHDPQKYLESLRDELSFNTFKTWQERIAAIIVAQTGPGMVAGALSKLFSFQCPVDVVIANADDTAVASVIGGEVNYYDSAFGEVMIFTSGDEKMILIQGDEPLTVHLTATDEGTMAYTVQTVNLGTGVTQYETAFLDVELTDGKQMQSTVDDYVDVPKVSLYVLDGNGNQAEEIQPNHEGPVEHWENPFTDVTEGEYYYNAVLWAVAKDITSGTSTTTFSPQNPCTRAQIVTFLWRAAGSPSVDTNNPFIDVTEGKYYYNAILWAVENGITSGTTANAFSPDKECTRAEAVTFLYRARNSPSVSGSNNFADMPPNAYYADAVQWAVNTSVTAGTSGNTFSPNQTCTRAQIVTFLYRDRDK